MKKYFDNEIYLKQQTECINERIKQFDNKLYLEFGGKLFDDLHAARVLPGFDPNNKIKILQHLKDDAEVLFCISADDIVSNKIRADFGITYSMEVLRVIDQLRLWGIYVSGVVITLFEDQPTAEAFRQKLLRRGENVYVHRKTKGYPLDVDTIVSEEGYGKACYIPTTRPLVVVTAPGPGSGKLATCLSQLYHESKRGNNAGYAKFETFPVWDLDLKHPVNIAYEAATADLLDVNMIDYFHLSAHGVTAVNYNRDLEVFPIVKSILDKIKGREIYASPTDMGVNTISVGITCDEGCREASKQEVIRRYFQALTQYKEGNGELSAISRIEMLMNMLGISTESRPVTKAAREYETQTLNPVFTIELEDGTIIKGKQSELMTATSAALLNAIKVLSKIPDDIKLLPPQVIEPILELNGKLYKTRRQRMTIEQTMVALTVSRAYSDMSEKAYKQLSKLSGCQAHSTRIISQATRAVLRKLGIEVTCEPKFISDDLYTD